MKNEITDKENLKRKEPVQTPLPAPGEDIKPTPLDRFWQILSRFQRFGWDLAGLAVLALSIMTLLALPGLPALSGGVLVSAIASQLRYWLGMGSLMLVLLGMVIGLLMLRQRAGGSPRINWMRVFALEITAFAALMLITLASGSSVGRAEAGLDGGIIGWGLVELLKLVLGGIGFKGIFWSYLVIDVVFLIACLYGLGLVRPFKSWLDRLAKSGQGGELLAEPMISMAPLGDQAVPDDRAVEARKKQTNLPAEFRKKFRIRPEEAKSAPPPPRDDRLPPLNLLVNEQSSR
ncbi:MAG: hypothetical protein ACM3PY_20955, partial [Omnitrophica WOR_2 bacterium]